jgi:5-methylcytosine-specific restriction endonuclease McrA
MGEEPLRRTMVDRCALCERAVETTRHHLVPKNRKESETVPLCQPCHQQVHASFTHYELKQLYDSVEALKETEEMRKFVDWIRKTDKTHVRVDDTDRVSDWRS